MAEPQYALVTCDPVWSRIRDEAEAMAREEPVMASFLYATVLNHDRFEQAQTYHLAQKLGNADVSAMSLRDVFDEAMVDDDTLGAAARADIVVVFDRDPACLRYVEPLLFFKGYHALQSHRIAHWLWRHNRRTLALHLQSRASQAFGVDIHPAARIGRGVFMDHATGIVIGETAVVEDDVSMLHSVNLGGTGKETGDRHPKIRRGALIGAGAKILGNIEVGECAKVGAASVVLKDVPARCTVAGVPARVIGCVDCDQPSRSMDHHLPPTVLEEQIQP